MSRLLSISVAGAVAVMLSGTAYATLASDRLVPLRRAASFRLSQLSSRLSPGNSASADQAAGPVVFTITPATTFPISPYIYGVNFLTDDGSSRGGSAPWYGATLPKGITLNRLGGNRFSAYNWKTNASNAGNDWNYQNDRSLAESGQPASAFTNRIEASMKRGAATMITVPMLRYVAGDDQGVKLDTLESTAPARLSAHFVPNRETRAAGDAPNTVYQDEFVRQILKSYPTSKTGLSSQLMVSLDNEPDIWHATHQEIQHRVNGQPDLQTYDGFADLSVRYLQTIKREAPNALTFGPATATYAGLATLGRYPSPDPKHGSRIFLEYYLERMRQAETQSGRRLLDVLDVHWYPAAGTNRGEINNDYAEQNVEMIDKRLQAPRSLWDAKYVEGSWVNQAAGGAIEFIPRLKRMIAQFYPGTKISISEYYFGRGGDISGGLAQADVLGIFGREGMFAAALWPQANVWSPPYEGKGDRAYAFVFGAFSLFRNYDGKGGTFGDTGLRAVTSDAINTSVYASRDSTGKVVIVAINKSRVSVPATIVFAGAAPINQTAHVWKLSSTSPTPVAQPDVTPVAGKPLVYVMPPLSASTLVMNQ